MKFERLLNEYIVDDIYFVRIYRNIKDGLFLIIIESRAPRHQESYYDIDSLPTFSMIENFIKKDF